MEAAALCYAAVASLLLFLLPFAFFFFFSSSLRRSDHSDKAAKKEEEEEKKKPPPLPSPPSLPVLGHLHLLKPPLPQTLANLSRRHGAAPVLLLRLGTRRVLLVSSAAAAEECFTTNDVAFASRPRSMAGEVLSYGSTTITTAPYGQLWRDLRRIATVELLSSHRLQGFSTVRAQEVGFLVKRLFQVHPGGNSPAKVQLTPALFGLTLNNMTRMMTGRRYHGEGAEGTEEATRFQEIVEESLRLRGLTNRWEYLPWLRWVDLKGVKRRMLWLKETRDVFLQKVVEEHRSRRRKMAAADGGGGDEDGQRTAVDVLLSLQEADPGYYTDVIIKSFIVGLLSPGSDTTATTIEWAMTLLLNHPQPMQTLRAELDALVQPPGRMLEEPDLPRLPFLHAVVCETLRLHPAAPILIPHESTADCTVAGFHVPRGTVLMVNAWAIHRDPTLWEDPDEFRPERFLQERGKEGSSSSSYRFIPFGSGRRRCPGEGLAMKMTALALGTLIQCFEWGRVGEGEEDMKEGTGITSPKAKRLEAMYSPREGMVGTLSQL